ncbi:DgyrCDS4320 [Dimorphilus gyrociliatus]|uniref:DgyrCDS4320 n=1 Tax=Dimorphilus gyrociliatus TaxID=2664684 RepID=A0A7I8VIW0_9ANNE|nr:DgyrCDS4320 [Dimorphilus gyrociliatus]
MIRRNNPTSKILALVAGGVLLLFVIYIWHDTLGRLRKSEETNEHLNQQRDSLSAQLRVIYEHKSKLEKSLRDDRQSFKKFKTELEEKSGETEKKFSMEKQSLLSKIERLKQDYKMLQSQHQDMESEFNRLNELYKKDKTDFSAERDKHHKDYLKLRDYASTLKESNDILNNKNILLENESKKLKNEILSKQRDQTEAQQVS